MLEIDAHCQGIRYTVNFFLPFHYTSWKASFEGDEFGRTTFLEIMGTSFAKYYTASKVWKFGDISARTVETSRIILEKEPERDGHARARWSHENILASGYTKD